MENAPAGPESPAESGRAGVPAGVRPALRRFVREPLVHFIAAALAIFLVSALVPARLDERETIRIGAPEIQRLAGLYASEAGRPPGAGEMQALIADHVEVSALAREARRLGLDDGDTVVERRLAQKMRFMINDLAVPPPPEDAVLRQWFDANPAAFVRSARTSFDHVFFRTAEDPRLSSVRAQLNAAGPPDWRTQGDAFMLERAYAALPDAEIDRLFGRDFTRALSELTPAPEWQGPVASAFGVHLIRVTARSAPETPPFESVRDEVLAHWQEAELARANAEAVREIVSRYKVEIEAEPR